jgi:hypothetical protein
MPERRDKNSTLKENAPPYRSAETSGISALDESLAMTPWERMLANDDIVNFGNMLRAAMEKRNAKPR